MKHAPIVIAAGGTGGHFFPAEALGETLKSRGYQLILMTDKRNTHASTSVFADCQRYTLESGGIAGKGLKDKLRGALRLLRGCLGARQLIRHHKPVAIVGFGGYPSVPPLIGSRLKFGKKPALTIHEGNAILGQANSLLARFADRIATSYPTVARLPKGTKTVLTGMPVRPAIEALAPLGYTAPEKDSDERIRLLIWGGSLGAQIFSTVVPQALANLPAALRARLHITQQVKQDLIPALNAIYQQAGIQADLTPFIKDVAAALGSAHLVIGRAGGSSIAELAMAGRPSILVPLPIAASDEQGANAHAMEKVGGGWMIRQSNFTSEMLTQKLTELFNNPIYLAQAAEGARLLQQRKAAEKLADLVETIIKA